MIPRITIQTFGYHKSGIPVDPSGHGGGYVFDCRGLLNPGREGRFRLLSGLDETVRDFLAGRPEAADFLAHCTALLLGTAESYKQRGFEHLFAAFGCTGGQHRSVYCAEKVAASLREAGYDVTVTHLERENWP